MGTEKVAIMVATCIDVPQEIIKQYNMYSVPVKIIYKDREYSDGVDITAEEVYARLAEEVPKSSLPGGNDIIEVFDRIKADGYEKVLAITLSSQLSGTFNLIQLIAQEYEGLEIATIDTKNIALAGGFNAIQAARLLEEGLSFDEVKAWVNKNIYKSKVFFCVETLEYLQKGGRIGLVSALLGTALNLKPIISCNENGVYYTVAKIRGRKKSIEKVIELALDYTKKGKRYNIALCHGGAKEQMEEVRQKIKSQIPYCEVYVENQISPVLGVHTGPGLIGIAVQILEE